MIRSENLGNKERTSLDALHRLIHETRELNRTMISNGGSSSFPTAALTALQNMETFLSTIDPNVQDIENIVANMDNTLGIMRSLNMGVQVPTLSGASGNIIDRTAIEEEKWLAIQVSTISPGDSISVLCSLDNVTFFNVYGKAIGGSVPNTKVQDITEPGLYIFPIIGKEFQITCIPTFYETSVILFKTDYDFNDDLVSINGTVNVNPINTNADLRAVQSNSFYPDPSDIVTDNSYVPLVQDSSGSLQVRGAVTTDEGSFRYDFEGTSLFTNGASVAAFNSNTVTGYGTSFLTDVKVNQYIKATVDVGTSWRQIKEIIDNETLILDRPYVGTTGTPTSYHISQVSVNAGSGASITNNNSIVTIAAGTSPSVSSRISRTVDYPALVGSSRVQVSQRIVNQDIYIGLSEQSTSTARWFAWFRINGTTANSIITETCGIKSGTPVAADIESYTITLPNGLTTASYLEYRIECKDQRVRFFINGLSVAEHTTHVPSNYDIMGYGVVVINGSTPPASNTNINIDYFNVNNINEIAVYNPSNVEGFVSYNRPGQIFTGTASANNVDILVFDGSQAAGVMCQFTGAPTATTSFQGSNDSVNWLSIEGYSVNNGTIATQNTIGGTSWYIPFYGFKYIRLRTTSYTSGTVTIFAHLLERPIPFIAISPKGTTTVTATNLSTNINQIGGQTLLTAQPGGASGRSMLVMGSSHVVNTDLSSTTFTASNFNVVLDGLGSVVNAVVDVTAVSGTNPTLDIILQESVTGITGTSYDIYHLERITATGRYYLPSIKVNGRRVWVYNIGGTSPSFTFSISTSKVDGSGNYHRSFYDRAIVANTLNSTTSVFNIEGCKQITVIANSGAATSPATFIVEFSHDRSNWYSLSAGVASVANATTLLLNSTLSAKFVRVRVSNAGTGQTLNYIHIHGTY